MLSKDASKTDLDVDKEEYKGLMVLSIIPKSVEE